MKRNESSDSLEGVRTRLFQVKERRSPLRLNVFGRGKAVPRTTGVQEHENRVQLSPGKGYLIGNESKIWRNINTCFAKGKQIRKLLFYGDTQGENTGASDTSGQGLLNMRTL